MLVGLRDLRHNTRNIVARVQHGETVEITDYGKPVARIVPVRETKVAPTLSKLIQKGRIHLATRPGWRPRMRSGDGTDQLGKALTTLRDEESW